MTKPEQSGTSSDELVAIAEDLGAIRRRVVNVVGHELRTPVTTLHGLSSQVCEATDLTHVTEVIGPAMLRTAERLTKLLDDLLIASGIDTAVPVDAPEPVDVAELAATIWSEVGSGEAGIEGEGVAMISPTGADRALRAVLENAAQYGTGAPRITISDGHGMVSITVEAPGAPITAAEARLATEPFFRGERAVTTRPGLGVGLAVASSVLDHAGGSLRFASGAASGTVTTMTVPSATRAQEAEPA